MPIDKKKTKHDFVNWQKKDKKCKLRQDKTKKRQISKAKKDKVLGDCKMDISEKKAYVLSALEKFSARSIDITGKGTNIKRLDKVSPQKTEDLYKRVLELERQKKDKSPGQKKDKSEEESPQWALSLQDKMEEVQNSLKILMNKVLEIESKIEILSFPKAKTKDKKAEEVLGFRIIQKWVISGGKRYLKWYGLKQSEGKQVWVYIGDKKEDAVAKIKAWGEKQR